MFPCLCLSFVITTTFHSDSAGKGGPILQTHGIRFHLDNPKYPYLNIFNHIPKATFAK